MLLSKKSYLKIFVLLLIVCTVKGEDLHSDPPSEAFPRENYAAIFKNIPRLFGHVMNLLEGQPEILERNDLRVKRAGDEIAGDERANDDERADDYKRADDDERAGNERDGDGSAGDERAGDKRPGDVRSADEGAGDERADDERAGDERADDQRASDEGIGCQEKRDQGLLDYVRSVLKFG